MTGAADVLVPASPGIDAMSSCPSSAVSGAPAGGNGGVMPPAPSCGVHGRTHAARRQDGRYTVLVVEDETTFAKNVVTYLARQGIVASAVDSGCEALSLVATQRPDVVLVDQDLPGMSGLELIVRLRGVDAALPVVMLTGRGDAVLAARAIEAGACAYLSKPIGLAEVKRALDRAASVSGD